MTPALVGLGTSFGAQVPMLRLAVAALASHADICVEAVAPAIWSKGIGPAKGPFLNSVVRLRTRLAPEGMLDVCKHIERRLGRRPSRRWGDRAVDLDVLLWGVEVIHTPRLTIPHCAMLERAFVLVPASIVAGSWRHPVVGEAITDLCPKDKRGTWSGPGLGGRLAGLRSVRYTRTPKGSGVDPVRTGDSREAVP